MAVGPKRVSKKNQMVKGKIDQNLHPQMFSPPFPPTPMHRQVAARCLESSSSKTAIRRVAWEFSDSIRRLKVFTGGVFPFLVSKTGFVSGFYCGF